MQGWCRWIVARLKSSNLGSDFSLLLGSLLFFRLAPTTLLGLGLTRHGEASGLLLHGLPCVQGIRSGRVPLQKSPYCTLELLVHTQPQPVLQ